MGPPVDAAALSIHALRQAVVLRVRRPHACFTLHLGHDVL